jgi:hypothetical protein
MNKAPRVLSTGINAGMAKKSRERVDSNKREKGPAMGAVITQPAAPSVIRPAQIGMEALIDGQKE